MSDHRELLTPESAAPYCSEVVFLRDARNGLEHTFEALLDQLWRLPWICT